MVHLDLFSGIGGFAYAADQVWDDVQHVFCDNDKFCQKVLNKHWPESEVFNDIKLITDSTFGRERKSQSERHRPGEQETSSGGKHRGVDILTGGFPCQPFSAAGLRRGTSDDRYLWPEMLRVIRLTQPEWVIAENVGGLVTWDGGLVLETVCADLEATGYEVQPFIIPAVAVDAPHRRDRIWFIAHRDGAGLQEEGAEQSATGSRREGEYATNAFGQRSRWRDENSRQVLGRQSSKTQDAGPSWEKNWAEVATEFCSVDDGLPVELDGFKLTKAQHRKEQLKAYGNAIVPQVAIEIMKGIHYANS